MAGGLGPNLHGQLDQLQALSRLGSQRHRTATPRQLSASCGLLKPKLFLYRAEERPHARQAPQPLQLFSRDRICSAARPNPAVVHDRPNAGTFMVHRARVAVSRKQKLIELLDHAPPTVRASRQSVRPRQHTGRGRQITGRLFRDGWPTASPLSRLAHRRAGRRP